MKILAIEPYYDGSHRDFIDSWIRLSGHSFTLETLPGYKWKWRMRHGAVYFADRLRELAAKEEEFDLLFCSDMLNLAEFRGLTGKAYSVVPAVIYYHENQLTYPVRYESERDYQFAMTNFTSALSASRAWFNTDFHRQEFLDAMEAFLRKMPDFQPLDAIEKIRARSEVYPPGIHIRENQVAIRKSPGPLHILWSARWEHDKNPELFFSAVGELDKKGVDFRLSVIGQSFRDVPEVFARSKEAFASRIVRWGFQETREDYFAALAKADVVVSTADHEFFGLSVLEAAGANAFPILPRKLSYPEIFADCPEFFYDGTSKGLAEKLAWLAGIKAQKSDILDGIRPKPAEIANRYAWEAIAEKLDRAVEQVLNCPELNID